MKLLANKHTLVALLSVAIVSAISLPNHAQFGGGGQDDEERLQKLEKKVHLLGKFMLDLKKSPLADMQNSQVSVFRLQYLRASSAADTISALLGNEGFRLAIEEKSNQLIVSAPAEISKAIGDLLQKIDAAPAQKNVSIATSQKQAAPKNLQVHTFWVADGLKDGEGRFIADFLPTSIFGAFKKLGLEDARIVAQSTSSIISNANSDDVKKSKQFGSKMSATINGRALQFESHGELYLLEHQQIDIQMRAEISGIPHSLDGRIPRRHSECEVEGSLSAPLGHYMVLGTANYVGKQPMAKNVKVGDTLPKDKLTTSRFAFVIQVVEAGSFAPEEKSREPRKPKESEFDPFADPIQPTQKPPTKK